MGIAVELKYQYEHRLNTAEAFVNEGKDLHALQIYNSLLDEYPERPEIYYKIASLFEKLKMIDPAVSKINSFISAQPENLDMRLFLGQFLLRNGRWEEAIECLSFIMPDEEPIVAFFLGYAHFMLKEYELAKINFLNFLAVEVKTELVHETQLYLAKIALELKNYESAISFAKKAELIYSIFWELSFVYASAYYHLDMLEHAQNSVLKAVKLNPDQPEPYDLAGKIYFKLGSYEKAEEYFLNYINMIDEVSSEAYTNLAESCMKIMKAEDALAYFDVAIKLDPLNKAAREGKIKASDILKATSHD